MKETELMTKDNEVIPTSENPLFAGSMVDFSSPDLIPDSTDNEAVEVELSSNYWTPEQVGESKAGAFAGIQYKTRVDNETGEELDPLPSAIFYTKENGSVTTFSNSSKVLLGIMEGVPVGAAVVITYKGKKKNKNNGFSSDTWSVKPLKISL